MVNHQKFGSLFERIDAFEKDKDVILKRWMGHDDVHDALSRHQIKEEFFMRHFGIKVINYAFGVIRGVNTLGNCPVIGAMLMFFDKKNIPLEDVFMICVNLKNTIITLMLERGALTAALLHEISYLIDHNFSGVVREYIDMHYEHILQPTTCSLQDNGVKNICTSLRTNDASITLTPAYQYLQEIDLDMDIIDELGQIERETLDSIDLSESMNISAYHEVTVLLDDYLYVINQLIEFQELAFALAMLSDLLKTTRFDTIGEESKSVLAIYIKAIISDFSIWRTTVFVNQDAENIHYLDQTLLSSIAQLQIMLSDSDAACTEEIEFF